MLISEFARLGQVSVRMLRHYDAIGLLTPARVEPGTGYRVYSPDQLPALNRIVALKDLGFDLRQVAALMTVELDVAELRGMLRLRQADLESQARAVDTRLTAVGARLRMIEKEDAMPKDYVLKTVPATRLVALSATLDPDTMSEHIEPLFVRVGGALEHEDGALSTPIATYAETEDGVAVVVGYAWSGPPPEGLKRWTCRPPRPCAASIWAPCTTSRRRGRTCTGGSSTTGTPSPARAASSTSGPGPRTSPTG